MWVFIQCLIFNLNSEQYNDATNKIFVCPGLFNSYIVFSFIFDLLCFGHQCGVQLDPLDQICTLVFTFHYQTTWLNSKTLDLNYQTPEIFTLVFTFHFQTIWLNSKTLDLKYQTPGKFQHQSQEPWLSTILVSSVYFHLISLMENR